MLRFKLTYILPIILLSFYSCKQTKFVPDGEYLLKKNKIEVLGDKLNNSDLTSILRQQPNYKQVGVKWKLLAYNSIDSAKVMNKRIVKNEELRLKNIEKVKRENKINNKRILKAQEKGGKYYKHKTIQLKDTADPKMFLREWYKYKIGRPPVVFDSLPYNKSIKQLNSYLKKKGYYYGNASGDVKFKRNGKSVVTYSIETGDQYIIDSVYFISDNEEIRKEYNLFMAESSSHSLINKPFDSDMLDDYRSTVSSHMKDAAFYGFTQNSISFIADTVSSDTTSSDLIVKLGVVIGDRVVRVENEKDSVLHIAYKRSSIREVYFHVADTSFYEGNFSVKIKSLGLSVNDYTFVPTFDSLDFTRNIRGDSTRGADFLYNEKLFVRPQVLEMLNHQERQSYYSEGNVATSYYSMLESELFSTIKTDMILIPGTDSLDVHYYLKPSERQSFSISPRATTSNGFLGVNATFSYTNTNLFRGAEKLTFSISGGFESQPPVFDETVDGETIAKANRSFNTLEIGPSIELEIPGFFPFYLDRLPKKLRPNTLIGTALNFQQRTDFTQRTLQLNYLWEFSLSKEHKLSIGLPGASVVKYVSIDKTPEFEERLVELNDLFLINAYSDQFVWQDWKLVYLYVNTKSKQESSNNVKLYFKTRFDPAGNLLSLFQNSQDTLDNGQYSFYGVGYSQFVRLDNEFIISKPFSRERSVHLRLLAGGGLPYGNSTTSLPYDNSFFGGGSNDNRGWAARNMGPGAYKYYLDTNRSSTQIGDVRLGTFLEFRFPINSFLKAAAFIDASNVWTVAYDEQRPGGQFSNSWYKEIALSAGFGVRIDFTYVILRFDLGIPIVNPALPQGAKWIFQSREPYYQEGLDFYGADYESYLPLPFTPRIHFGIGYPF